MTTREKVFSPGDEIELVIESVNHQGQGVGRYREVAVFVPFTIPGEQVTVRIVETKKNYAVAETVRLIRKHDQRVNPRCSHFEACGGSRFQHIDYDLQLEIKRKLVLDALTRIGKLSNPVVHPVLGMSEPWGYRNKVQYQVRAAEGCIRLGFFEEGTHAHVANTDCLLVDSHMREIAGRVEELLNQYHLTGYNWATGKGLLRHVVVRRGLNTSEIMVVLVTSAERAPVLTEVAQTLRSDHPEITSVVRNINRSSTRWVFGEETEILSGQGTISERVGDLVFAISPTSFFQVNSRQMEVLYGKALEYAALSGEETVLDVYCGTGTISLFLARQARRVIGFEVLEEAVRDAAKNAQANNIKNVEFIAGKAEERLPALVKRGIKPEVIVVDPPRQGIEKRALQAIADMNPERIVYVSCDPATMARDVNMLGLSGYELVEAQPVDMFPQTSHVECVVLMSRAEK